MRFLMVSCAFASSVWVYLSNACRSTSTTFKISLRNFLEISTSDVPLLRRKLSFLATTDGIHWVLGTTERFDIYTDHDNLILFFGPLAVILYLAVSSICKLLRWAVRFSMCNHASMFTTVIDNVWNDIIGLWPRTSTVRYLVTILELTSSN